MFCSIMELKYECEITIWKKKNSAKNQFNQNWVELAWVSFLPASHSFSSVFQVLSVHFGNISDFGIIWNCNTISVSVRSSSLLIFSVLTFICISMGDTKQNLQYEISRLDNKRNNKISQQPNNGIGISISVSVKVYQFYSYILFFLHRRIFLMFSK